MPVSRQFNHQPTQRGGDTVAGLEAKTNAARRVRAARRRKCRMSTRKPQIGDGALRDVLEFATDRRQTANSASTRQWLTGTSIVHTIQWEDGQTESPISKG